VGLRPPIERSPSRTMVPAFGRWRASGGGVPIAFRIRSNRKPRLHPGPGPPAGRVVCRIDDYQTPRKPWLRLERARPTSISPSGAEPGGRIRGRCHESGQVDHDDTTSPSPALEAARSSGRSSRENAAVQLG
jgi:hypothetical protein